MSDEDKSAQSHSSPPVKAQLISRELQLRLASGVVVAVIAFAAIWAGPPVPFSILVFAIAAAMSWEWGRIVRQDGFDAVGLVHIASVGAAATLSALGMEGLGVAAVAIGAIAASALLFGGGQAKLSGLGVLYTGLPVVALIWLRSDETLGMLAVIFVVLTVATTDIAAYASGRTFGGPKLAPHISPGKTWAGLIGGVLAATLAGGLLGLLTQRGNPGWMALMAFLLALVAQGGDLAESALKRTYGLKDSSNLIPGHGGFMDRMDGVVAAAVVAAFVALTIDVYAPARALLHGS